MKLRVNEPPLTWFQCSLKMEIHVNDRFEQAIKLNDVGWMSIFLLRNGCSGVTRCNIFGTNGNTGNCPMNHAKQKREIINKKGFRFASYRNRDVGIVAEVIHAFRVSCVSWYRQADAIARLMSIHSFEGTQRRGFLSLFWPVTNSDRAPWSCLPTHR
jgi:hypothetical protein